MAAEENPIASTATAVPEVASPTAVTVVDASPSAAVVEAPTPVAAAPEAVSTVEPIAAIIETPKPIETLLSQTADKPIENVVDIKPTDKPVETKDSAVEKTADKKDEASQSEKAPLPTYELKLPDDIKLIPKEGQLTFTTLLGEYESKVQADPKSIHTAFQELGQEMMNRHIAEVKNLTATMTTQAEAAKAAQRESWKEEFLKDPVYGGDRKDTTIKAAEKAIKTYGGNAKEQQEFRDALMSTGLINNKAMIRVLANVTEARPSPVPLAAKAPAPQAIGMIQKRYGRPSR